MEPQRVREKWGDDKKKREGGGERGEADSPFSLLFVVAPLFARSLRFNKPDPTDSLTSLFRDLQFHF